MKSYTRKRTKMVVAGFVFLLALGLLPLEAATYSDGKATVSTNNSLPSNWPADAPTYPGGTINYSGFANQNESGNSMAIILDATDPLQKVVSFYKQSLPAKGWKIISESSMGEMTVLAAEKEGKTYSIAIVGNGERTQITSGIANQ